MAEIQGIEFEVKGSSDKAAASLDKLAKTLTNLKKVTSGGLGLSALSGSLKEISAAINKLNADKVRAFASAMKELGKVKLSQTFANSLTKLSDSLAKVDAKKLTAIQQAMSGLQGNEKAKVSIAGVGSLGKAIEAVGNNPKALADLVNYFQKLGAIDFTNLRQAAEDIRAIVNASNDISQTPTPTVPSVPSVQPRGKGQFSKTAEQTAKDLLKIDREIGRVQASIAKLQEAINSKKLTPPDIEQAKQRIEEYQKVLEGLYANRASIIDGSKYAPSEEATRKWDGLIDRLKQVAKWGATKALNGIKGAFQKSIKPVKDFSSKLGNVASSFKRILGYRLVRTLIKEIGQAFREGIQNVYQWSKAFGGPLNSNMMTFAQTMDDIATSLQYFKNGVGAAFAPLANLLAPAIRVVTDAAVELLNVVNQLIALLTGASGWTKAIRKADEYGEAVGGAGGAAKEALKYLAPFDELNVLPDDKKGGGGGGSLGDYGGMFEEMTEFESGIKDFAERIKEAINASDWKGLGELLGGKVNEIVDKIDFAGIGSKIGGYINAWFTTKYWTLKEINFQNIGKKISEFLTGDGKDKKGVIGSIDWDTFGKSVAQKFTILPDIIIGALDGINFTKLGEAIGKFVGGISEEFTKWLNTINWEQKGKDLVQDVIDLFSGLKDAGTAEKVAGFFTALWNAVKGLFTGIWKAAFNGETYSQNLSVQLNINKASLPKPKTATISTVSLKDALTALAAGLIVFTITGSVVTASIAAALTLGFTSSHLDFDEIKDADAKTIQDYIKHLDEQFKDAKQGTYEYQYYQHFKSAAEAKLKEAAKAGGSTFKTSLDEELGSFSGRSGSFGEVTIPVTAETVEIKDKLKPSQKSITTKANITSRVNNLSDKEKQLNIKANFTSRINSLSDKEKKINTKAAFDSSENNLGTPKFSSLAEINSYNVNAALKDNGYFKLSTKVDVVGQTNTPTLKAKVQWTGTTEGVANGGAFFNNRWHNIPQYANGTTRAHGSLFLAGEAGPEIVGHVGGRTEVLNKSQIAATMYSAVVSAMSGLRFAIPSYTGGDTDVDTEDMMYRAFSRALSETDFGGDIELDGDTLYRKMVSRNRQNTRLTGVNAMA